MNQPEERFEYYMLTPQSVVVYLIDSKGNKRTETFAIQFVVEGDPSLLETLTEKGIVGATIVAPPFDFWENLDCPLREATRNDGVKIKEL